MTLRPPKHSDRKKIEAAMQKKQKEVELNNKLPSYTLVICEGIKTEVHYIQGLVNLINAKYSEIYRRYSHLFPKERIKVFGTGRNTKSLLKYARDYAKKPENKHYTRIWLMYDKDDFPYDNFDNTQLPKPGLIQKAIEKYPDIQLNQSFMAGDSLADMELAKYYKLKFFGG